MLSDELHNSNEKNLNVLHRACAYIFEISTICPCVNLKSVLDQIR